MLVSHPWKPRDLACFPSPCPAVSVRSSPEPALHPLAQGFLSGLRDLAGPATRHVASSSSSSSPGRLVCKQPTSFAPWGGPPGACLPLDPGPLARTELAA